MRSSKTIIVLIISVLVSATFIFSEEKPPRTYQFNKEGKYLTPQLGINAWTIPFGVNFEYGLKKNIGVGANAMLWLWSDGFSSHTIVDLAANAAYHFTGINVDKLDLYAGGGLGITIYSFRWKYEWLTGGGAGSSGIYITPFIGARYFFSPKMAVHLRLGGTLIGSWTGFGSTIGITFGL